MKYDDKIILINLSFLTIVQDAEFFFKHNGGQYSAFDMAQYVFWTGDEEGVAKAIEEFIDKGMVCIRII